MHVDPQMREYAIRYPRLYGFFLVALGLALLTVLVLLPVLRAMDGAEDIGWYSGKAAIIGIGCVALGLVPAIGGRRGFEFLNPQAGRSKAPVITLSVIVMGTGLACAIALDQFIESLGYFGG